MFPKIKHQCSKLLCSGSRYRCTLALIMNFTPKANLIWNIAELLRGSWKQHEYQDVILPFTVLKRLDSVLEKTKQEVLRESHLLEERGVNPDPILRNITKVGFYNTSQFTFKNLLDEQTHLEKNFKNSRRENANEGKSWRRTGLSVASDTTHPCDHDQAGACRPRRSRRRRR